MHDFGGYKLITDDGTQYIYQRNDLTDYNGTVYDYDGGFYWAKPKGQPYLSQITIPTGETINMNVNPKNLQIGQQTDTENMPLGIQHQIGQEVTKAIKIDYEGDRIAAIWAPMEQTGTVPTVKYGYDSAGNLQYVRKLADKTLATSSAAAGDPNLGYEVLVYEYDNTQFDPSDHYITAIKDPRGLQPIRYVYDDAGRLVKTIDAKDNEIELTHNISDRKETVYDRTDTDHRNPMVYFYNSRGNVTKTIKYVNGEAKETVDYAYDDTNNPNKQTSVTNYVPDPGNPSETVPAVTRYFYSNFEDEQGPVKDKIETQTVIDPVGNLSKTVFDTNGNVRESTQGKNPVLSSDGKSVESFEEVLTTRTYYTVKDDAVGIHGNLPYLTGTTTGQGSSLVWHSLSLTYYDDMNRVTYSVQVNMDYITGLGDLYTSTNPSEWTYSYLKAPTALPSPSQHSLTSYHYFTSTLDAGYSPDQPSYIVGLDGQTQVFSYDKNNKQIASWNVYDDPFSDDYCQYQSVSDYDDAGRVVQSRQVVANAAGSISNINRILSQTFYTSLGKVDYTLDENGTKTVYDYDQSGNTVQTTVYQAVETPDPDHAGQTITTYEPLTITQTLYDKNDRVLVSVAAFDASDTAAEPTGTETVYDALGRTIQTRQWNKCRLNLVSFKVNTQGQAVFQGQSGYSALDSRSVAGLGVPTGITPANAWDGTGTQPSGIGWTSDGKLPVTLASPSAGQTLAKSISQTDYDSAGRVWKTWTMKSDRSMVCTNEYTYDLAGRQVDVITLPDTDEASVTTTEYDGSRRSKVTDGKENTTEFIYDSLGRVVTTQYNESTSVTTLNTDRSANTQTGVTYIHVGYDGLGRKIWESQRTSLPRTSVDQTTDPDHALLCKDFAYNTAGQLVGVTLPSDTANRPQYDYFYDIYGNQIGILDPQGQLTVTILFGTPIAYA